MSTNIPTVTDEQIDALVEQIRQRYLQMCITAIADPAVGHQLTVAPTGEISVSQFLGSPMKGEREYYGKVPHETSIELPQGRMSSLYSPDNFGWIEDAEGDYVGDIEHPGEDKWASVDSPSEETKGPRTKGWKRFRLDEHDFLDEHEMDCWSEKFDREHAEGLREWARKNYRPKETA